MTLDQWGDEYTPPDLVAIRQVLVQLQNEHRNWFDISADNADLVANAPAWLASLCDEVDRQRERNTYIRHCNDVQADKIRALTAEHKFEPCITEINELRAENERLRAELAAQPASYWGEVMKPLFAERNTLLTVIVEKNTEIAQLKSAGDLLIKDVAEGMSRIWRMAYDSGYQAGHSDGYTKGRFYPERL